MYMANACMEEIRLDTLDWHPPRAAVQNVQGAYISLQKTIIQRLAAYQHEGDLEAAAEYYVQSGLAEVFHDVWEGLAAKLILPNKRHVNYFLEQIGLPELKESKDV